ncbi:TOBE domain-containing protein [Pseudomonas sp. F(2018)]|uniref:TOBE domain-containing protein n=1 Tax=Pseudomonas sp. F(2018) TaxID=2502240 RepID=UPI0010F7D780|nr:TOBE domain-containing protein [Pseudomonas sp. F(2018)]
MTLLTALSQHIARRPQRIALLQQVAEQGSITRAAKAAGLSYKAAWDAIDELNNLAGQALVERSVGGKGGGGARLSATGARLLQLYRRLEQLQAQLFDAAEQDADLALLGRLMLRTSARNQLSGRVSAIQPQGRNDLIEITLDDDNRLRAQITHDSTLHLELAIGSTVVALFKAGCLELLPSDPPAEGALRGEVEEVLDEGDGPCEVRIALPGGQRLCALLDARQLPALDLAASRPIQARVSPAQVLLGIAT